MPPARFLWFLKIPIQNIHFSVCFLNAWLVKNALVSHEGLFLSFHSRTAQMMPPTCFFLQGFIRILPLFPKIHQILDYFSFYFIYKNKQRGSAMTPERANECLIPFSVYSIYALLGRIKTRFSDQNFARRYFVFFWELFEFLVDFWRSFR